VACRLLGVSRSGFYAWRNNPVSLRGEENELLLKHIRQIHADSRGTYGSPRVHAELTLGLGLAVNEKRVARLMRAAAIRGLYWRRRRGCTVRDPDAEPAGDLVNRQFTATAPNQLWVTDITEHPTDEGKLYCAAVLDVFSRRIIGWSIADNMRKELVLDALGMAVLRRGPGDGNRILHSDHGSQFTSWAWGMRLLKSGIQVNGGGGGVGDAHMHRAMQVAHYVQQHRDVPNVCHHNEDCKHSGILSPALFSCIDSFICNFQLL
jgi:putative transposase